MMAFPSRTDLRRGGAFAGRAKFSLSLAARWAEWNPMHENRDVPIEITSRHEPLSDRMRAYATDKVGRLTRFHNRISRIHLVIDGAHEEPSVELLIHVDSGATLVAREHREHFKSAVDLLVDKMERQLKKNNERRKDHHRGHGASDIDEPVPADEASEETYDDVVRRDLT